MITTVTYADYVVAARKQPAYFRGRWPLIAATLAMIQPLLPDDPARVLELGPMHMPLVPGSDTMELASMAEHVGRQPTYTHDATVAPWPIEGDRYDLFIALQVFEHLGPHDPGVGQRHAWAEVCRVARAAVISLPYLWDCRDASNCHGGITRETIASWTGRQPDDDIVLQTHQIDNAYRRRIICSYQGLR